MVLIENLFAALSLAIWIYLLCLRGGFWRVKLNLPAPSALASADSVAGKAVVAVIPARDEADVIGEAVASLLGQEFGGSLRVIVVDDDSSDGTAAVARDAAARLGATGRLTVLAAGTLPPGWSGKVWAMSRGANAAVALDPDFILFTDADILHAPRNVAALVEAAEAGRRDLVSYMVRLSTANFAERRLIPAFVFFFFKLYPPAWIASPHSRVAGAAGGCMLIRPAALARAGGLAAIRSEIIDDCALARAVKRSGGSVSLGLTRNARSARPYGSFAEIGRMISRTAFNQLRHSYLLLAGTLLGLVLTYLLPPLLVLCGAPAARGLAFGAWTLMSLAYLPMIRFYGQSVFWCVNLPLVAAFYAGATLDSAIRYRRGSGGQWKGRVQDRPVS